MPSPESLQAQFIGRHPLRSLLLPVVACGTHVHSACTANVKFTFILRVQIQKYLSFEYALFKVPGTSHAGFFINREQRLQRAVSKLGIGHRRHGGSHSYTIVSAKRGAFCLNPSLVNPGFNGIFLKVKFFVGILLGHHVNMSLKNYSLAVLQPFGGRFSEDHVPGFVNNGLKTVFLSELFQEFRHPVLLLGGMRHLCYFIEIVPQELWFKFFNLTHGYLSYLLLLSFLQYWASPDHSPFSCSQPSAGSRTLLPVSRRQ